LDSLEDRATILRQFIHSKSEVYPLAIAIIDGYLLIFFSTLHIYFAPESVVKRQEKKWNIELYATHMRDLSNYKTLVSFLCPDEPGCLRTYATVIFVKGNYPSITDTKHFLGVQKADNKCIRLFRLKDISDTGRCIKTSYQKNPIFISGYSKVGDDKTVPSSLYWLLEAKCSEAFLAVIRQNNSFIEIVSKPR